MHQHALPHVTALLFSVKEVFRYPKDELGGECGDPEASVEYERRQKVFILFNWCNVRKSVCVVYG